MRFFFILIATISLIAGCTPNNVTIDDSLGNFFTKHKAKGTFGIFDNGQGQFTIYNLTRFKDSAYTPASTFKIVNSLIAIKTGRITDEKTIINWDGVVRTYPGGDTAHEWNRNLSMVEAFKYSAVPYYQEVARRIGKDTMQYWLDSLAYGNKKISTIDSFWLDNSLKITADEQLGLVKRLYFEQLLMDKRPQRIVKQMMLQEQNSNYELAYKTGWGTTTTGKEVGWVVGWIEENRHPYFFVLNLEGDKGMNMPEVRNQLLDELLRHLGFKEGKK